MIGYIIATVVLVLIDQGTKLLALTKLKPIGNMTVIKGFMDFTFVENRGAAFGMLQGQQWLFIVITFAVAVGAVILFKKMAKEKEYNLVRLATVLVMGGAFGNVIDRIARGYVVDFFEFTFISYPVFNVADIYIVCGAIWLAYITIFLIKEEPKTLALTEDVTITESTQTEEKETETEEI